MVSLILKGMFVDANAMFYQSSSLGTDTLRYPRWTTTVYNPSPSSRDQPSKSTPLPNV